MKYGVNLFMWTSVFTRDKLNLISKIKKIGFDGAELPIRNLEDVDIEGTKVALEENGLGCTLCPLITPERSLINPSTHKEAIDYLISIIKLANKWQSRVIGGAFYTDVGAGKNHRSRTKEEWCLAVKGLKELSKIAEDYNVNLGLEVITRFETSFLNIAEDAVRLVAEVDSPNIGVHLDTFHMNIEEKDIYTAIKNTGKHLVHFHVGENDKGIPGTGHIDWGKVSKALKEISYDKWIVFETFIPEVKEMIPSACVWRNIIAGKTADEAAKETLEFLKQKLE